MKMMGLFSDLRVALWFRPPEAASSRVRRKVDPGKREFLGFIMRKNALPYKLLPEKARQISFEEKLWCLTYESQVLVQELPTITAHCV